MAPRPKGEPDRAATPGRVSPTAPDSSAPSFQAWDEALSDPQTRAELDKGLADVEAGRTKPWSEIRRRVQ